MTPSTVAVQTAERLTAAAGLNATLDWSPELLATEATAAEAIGAGALHGMALAVKDNIVTAEQPTTCASKILEGYQSPFTATAVNRLRAAGGMVACKANLDEFAMGSSTEHSAYGRVLHPMNPDLVPGGSSGGSAALVAAGVVPAALGSETGGSVRQPASFCGIVGVKPSYGLVSRWGLVAFGSSLDCISVFGDTVARSARVLEAISGHDPQDATTFEREPLAPFVPRTDLKGLRVGLPKEYFPDDLDPAIRAGCNRTIALLRELGAELVEVSLPHTAYAVPTYYVLNPAEAAANLARFDGVRYGARRVGLAGDLRALYQATRGQGFGPEVRRRILVGTYVLSAGYYDAYYARAQQVRRHLALDFQNAFAAGVDLLFTPTTPSTAFAAGANTGDPVAMYLADVFVCAVSLAGLPALSIPIGRDQGLPIGGQLIAPFMQDGAMLAAADVMERHLDATGEVR
ncbi:MAG: Asp-tRNA(Asn)/Glu-tRNA(Gln) amidotransferase subunit GatA [Gemmatimonadota bacterium]|nr:Asp-tRNA(Asn)/Glu-tRNA(Gln) amidotransferase subunit GatA [Gemmatimonadota bacterium]